MDVITKTSEVLCPSINLRQCTLQVSGNTLQQVEEFRYRGVVFTNEGGTISKANAVLPEL